MGKFADQATSLSLDLGAVFSRSIRRALLAGLNMAVQRTHHDSSNAAAHWLIAGKTKSRPSSRKWGKLRDLRATSTRPGTPPVGKRRSYGINQIAAQRFVRDRELKDVVDKLVAGRNPETIFYFYNAIDPTSEYGQNADIGSAASAAVEEVQRVFMQAIESGQIRKKYR